MVSVMSEWGSRADSARETPRAQLVSAAPGVPKLVPQVEGREDELPVGQGD
jgi:hypothetical protein